MSIYLELIPAIAAATSALAAAYSGYNLKSKVEAEKHFVSKLQESKDLLQEIELKNLQTIRNKIVHDVEVSDEDISKAVALLESYIVQMNENDKKYINEAVLQESLKGRLRYIDKIITKLGIEPDKEYNKQSKADA
jgi:hypothetical protein